MKYLADESFENVSLEQLRRRTSEKWCTYPPDVLPAFVAEMDFALAPPVAQAIHEAVDRGDCGYAGIANLVPAFRSFAAQRFGWNVDDRSVFAVPDVMAGVAESLAALTDVGAGVVINPPVYPPFFEVIRNAGRSIVEVPLTRDSAGAWSIDFDAMENAFARGAKAYLLCSPHNPVGRVWSRQELERVASLAQRYSVVVISDEIFAPLTMPGVTHTPFLYAANDQAAIVLMSGSKAWNIAGLKCALMVTGSDEVRTAVRSRLKANPTAIRWRIGQLGAIANTAAFAHGVAWLDNLREHLDHNRRLLADLLERHTPRVRYRAPDATYLTWIDCTELGLGSDPAAHFLSRGRVALEAGYQFGKPGENYVRLNMGTSSAILTEIVKRMAAAL